MSNKVNKIILALAGFLFFLNIFAWQEVFALRQAQDYLMVDFLDVGQGDSAFIQTPENHQILIDGGPNSSVLNKLSSLMPFWDKTIDVVILTHPEKDHMQGILDVLQRYKVDYFLWTGVKRNNAENKKLADILNKIQKDPKGISQNFLLASFSKFNGTKIITVSNNDKIKVGDLFINIIHPFENMAGQEPKNTNDSSIVSRLVFGKNSFLFTGDISTVAEKSLVNLGENILSNVLKVAHHGSKYSTSDLFLENVMPEIAVISVGAKNSYGHPTSEALQRLEKFGIKVFRTDENEDVKLISDGNTIKLLK